jgi:hypothetical protein
LVPWPKRRAYEAKEEGWAEPPQPPMPPDIEPHVTQLVQMGFQLASRVDPQRLVHAPHPHLQPHRLRLRRLPREAPCRAPRCSPGTSHPNRSLPRSRRAGPSTCVVTLLICASVTHLQPQVNSDSSAGYRPMPKLLGTPAERIRTPEDAAARRHRRRGGRWRVIGS